MDGFEAVFVTQKAQRFLKRFDKDVRQLINAVVFQEKRKRLFRDEF
jgi:mRNA-degrading endonuclease RelE of RelBE toxin-antitoxin system